MNTIQLKPNQGMLDMILMACGTLEGGMQLMMANNVSITDTPAANAVFTVPADITTDSSTQLFLQQNGIIIGTKDS